MKELRTIKSQYDENPSIMIIDGFVDCRRKYLLARFSCLMPKLGQRPPWTHYAKYFPKDMPKIKQQQFSGEKSTQKVNFATKKVQNIFLRVFSATWIIDYNL